jgi:hypothetical protein
VRHGAVRFCGLSARLQTRKIASLRAARHTSAAFRWQSLAEFSLSFFARRPSGALRELLHQDGEQLCAQEVIWTAPPQSVAKLSREHRTVGMIRDYGNSAYDLRDVCDSREAPGQQLIARGTV